MKKDIVLNDKQYSIWFEPTWITIWEYVERNGLAIPRRSLTFNYSDIKTGPNTALCESWAPMEVLNDIKKYVNNQAFW